MNRKSYSLRRGRLVWRLMLGALLVTAVVASLAVPTSIVSAQPVPIRVLPAQVTPGEIFEVTVTFSASDDAFGPLALVDEAPAGWAATVDKSWCDPGADEATVEPSTPNRAEYIWYGSSDIDTPFSVVYKVTVPIEATPGTYTFDDGDIGYSIAGAPTAHVGIGGDFQVVIPAAPPTVTSVDPNSGSQSATLDAVITGTNFTAATTENVSFGAGITVDNVTLDSSIQITAVITIANDAATGTRDVSVTTSGGTGTVTAGFTVTAAPPPTVTLAEPNAGSQGATLDVVITGTNFTAATDVSLGAEITINSFTVDSATQVTASVSVDAEATPGTRDVSVTNPWGTGTLTDGFTVVETIILAEVQIEPTSVNLEYSANQTFTATGFDQFDNDITGEVSFVWSVDNVTAGGIVATSNTTALFTAGTTSGTFTDVVKVVGTRDTVEKEAFATVVVFGAATSTEITAPAEVPATTVPGEVAPLSVLSFGEATILGATAKDAADFDIPQEVVTANVTWVVLDPNAGSIDATTGNFTPGTEPGIYRNAIQATVGAAVETYSVIVLPPKVDTTNVKVATVAAALPADVDAVTEADAEVSFSAATGAVTGDIMVTKYIGPPEPAVAFAALKFVDVFASFGVGGASGTATVTIHYIDAEIGTTVIETSLLLYYWDGAAGRWKTAANSSVDVAANEVSGDVPVEVLSGAPIGAGNPSLTLTPNTGVAATTLTGTGFQSNSSIAITWAGTPVTSVGDNSTDANGDFTAIISIPTQTTAGAYVVEATDGAGNFATADFTVVDVTGTAGSAGASGSRGRSGEPGAEGAAGEPGAEGAAGEPGAEGVAGEPGAEGVAGEPGAEGVTGEPGAEGAAGEPGAEGAAGEPGAEGAAGEPGPQGEPGAQGEPGPSGPIGIIIAALALGIIGAIIGIVALLRGRV